MPEGLVLFLVRSVRRREADVERERRAVFAVVAERDFHSVRASLLE